MIRCRPATASPDDLPRFTQAFYTVGQLALRAVKFNTLRIEIIRPRAADRSGGYVLAPTHISHLEPFILSTVMRRQVDWMSRLEFYRRWWARRFLDCVGAFSVNRQGVPVQAIRTAIGRVTRGRIVGVFPEGGVANGTNSVCRGGPIKLGACLIAYRAHVPVLPCIVIGTHELNRIWPWIPFRRAQLWIAFGDAIWPDLQATPRTARAKMGLQMREQYRSLCSEIFDAFKLDERSIP